MRASPFLRWWLRRLSTWISIGVVALVFALAILVPTSFVAVERSSQPEFCNSCHIMEPYYESWQHSAHADVACTECHFEPGTLGTVRGKFQAITQLAKYVTRTQGTRPWADVSDASCLRSGCHSPRSLEGPIPFGRVSFDHGPHLLEVRGQRLRCVTCHSQVLVDQHFAVERTVCFACHFHPEEDGHPPARTSDCTTCHGPPAGALEVAGRTFEHEPYLRRGVDCQACHADVIAGTGTVHMQRCRSCHGEPEILARSGEAELLHRAHVTDKKVECFECHVEIQHGREAAAPAHPAGDQACNACHDGPHSAAQLVYAGSGARGVAAQPSRMHETHVACAACHTGRAGGAHGSSALASAGEVDCLHCHGTGYAGMLAEWQSTVGAGLAGLRPMLAELRASAPAESEELRMAEEDLTLLERDGSRGAHNAPYALDVLRSVAQRIDRARSALVPGGEASAAALLPPPADAGCAACHLDVAQRDPLQVHARPFRHADHLRTAGLACAECHLAEPHGAPAFSRDQCASCHHAEREGSDPSDCASCHALQQSFFTGSFTGSFAGALAGLEPAAPEMPDKTCNECHGEAPDIVLPPPNMCVLCHGAGYDQKLADWNTATDERVARLERALAAAPPGTDAAALARARQALELVAADGSRGVHNASLTWRLLDEALVGLPRD
jgi:nitrate/TMAO reductase-like tetraheme cytochrome c subunit